MAEKKKNWRGWLKNPRLPREGETIGGGYFVFRRGDDTKRIRPAMWPFEYETYVAAAAQAQKHAEESPGYQFDIVAVVASVSVPSREEEAAA